MSAPGPEKWMPSSFEILLSLKDLTVDSLSQSVQAPRLTALVKKAARRRAIEELKALAGGATQEPGNQWDLGPVYSVGAGEILARIAAIEAEEA